MDIYTLWLVFSICTLQTIRQYFFLHHITQCCMWAAGPAQWLISEELCFWANTVLCTQPRKWVVQLSVTQADVLQQDSWGELHYSCCWLKPVLHIGVDQGESGGSAVTCAALTTCVFVLNCLSRPQCMSVIAAIFGSKFVRCRWLNSCRKITGLHVGLKKKTVNCWVKKLRAAHQWASIPLADACSPATQLRATQVETQLSGFESSINFSSTPSQRILVPSTSYSFHIHIHLLPEQVLSAACVREIWPHLMPDSGFMSRLSTPWEAT